MHDAHSAKFFIRGEIVSPGISKEVECGREGVDNSLGDGGLVAVVNVFQWGVNKLGSTHLTSPEM